MRPLLGFPRSSICPAWPTRTQSDPRDGGAIRIPSWRLAVHAVDHSARVASLRCCAERRTLRQWWLSIGFCRIFKSNVLSRAQRSVRTSPPHGRPHEWYHRALWWSRSRMDSSTTPWPLLAGINSRRGEGGAGDSAAAVITTIGSSQSTMSSSGSPPSMPTWGAGGPTAAVVQSQSARHSQLHGWLPNLQRFVDTPGFAQL